MAVSRKNGSSLSAGMVSEEEDSVEDSVDEDALEDAPKCVQETINKLLKSRSQWRLQNKSLKMKLKKAHVWCEELRLQIEELNAKLATRTNKKCSKCLKFKRQARTLKAELELKNVETDTADTQTTEEDLRQAAWIFQYNHNTAPRDNSNQNKEDMSLAESIRATAESVLNVQGMVLEETSGLYYDYKTGYYYDAERSLYYDGSSGTYLKYNEETKEYKVDSSLPPEEIAAQRELAARRQQQKLHTIKKRKLSEEEKNDPEDVASTSSNGNTNTAAGGKKDGRVELGQGGPGDADEEVEESSIPCVRLVVMNTEDERVKLGTLFIVTCKGGTIGSKGQHEVLLPDLGCSKLHARISFQSSNLSYYLRDLGSRNGTWVNGRRLSAAKEPSKDIIIGHKTCIQIGKTKLNCHVHPGSETCLECEPGLIKQDPTNMIEGIKDSSISFSTTTSLELQRKQELRDMKSQYGIGPGLDETRRRCQEALGFTDRAEQRRQQHGIDPVGAKTEAASVYQAIGDKNKGFRMLEKMGWEGGGLGRTQAGIQEPVLVEQRAKQSGLGCSSLVIPAATTTEKEMKKNEIWKKTQKRFNKTAVLDAFKQESEDDT